MTLLFALTTAHAGFVDFDDVDYPCLFNDSAPLTDEYLAENILFEGSMEPLNKCGSFGVTGYSSPNFLGYNIGSSITDINLGFPTPVDGMSMLIASASTSSITITSFDSAGLQLDSFTHVPTAAGQTVEVLGPDLANVEIVPLDGTGVIDDITIGADSITSTTTLAERATSILAILDNSWTTQHGTVANLPTATRVESDLQQIVNALNAGGCLIDPVADAHFAASYQGSTLLGADDLGALTNGTLTRPSKSFGATLSTGVDVGTEAGAFSAYNKNRQIIGLRDDGGFVAGRWIRRGGTNGMLFGITGTCDGPTDALTALDGWWRGDALP
jgi:hypothetical protein